jgi:ABC-2 type transport system ATP-binding protein
MTSAVKAIEVHDLVYRYKKTDAVNGLDLMVPQGRCYGFFGRNGAGKSTTIKCLLNHLRPKSGTIRVFGTEPRRDEVRVKRHIGYVPEQVAFHPWMTARNVLDYAASFREHWNRDLETDLLKRFQFDAGKRVDAMSKGMRSQLSLVCAICPEPDMLLLDEPTSGLDPVVRREFLQTVIGAYLEGAPGRRTVFVSTHLISEWEGLIDEFTLIEKGRNVLTLETEAARDRFRRVHLVFAGDPPDLEHFGATNIQRDGHSVMMTTSTFTAETESRLRDLKPETMRFEHLSLEEIFVAVAGRGGIDNE